MSFVSSQKSRLLVADFSLSASLKTVDSAADVDMLDTTTLADSSKQFLPGGSGSKWSLSGLLDVDGSAAGSLAHMDTWKSTAGQIVTYGPSGLTLGSELWSAAANETSLKTGGSRAGLATLAMDAETDGPLDIGRALHDLTAETTTGNGTGYDGSASSANGGAGYLHVTAFSGLTNIVVKVQHSSDDGGGDPYADVVTFTTVTGQTSERVVVAGTVKRYLRAVWTKSGTGSCTFMAGFARR